MEPTLLDSIASPPATDIELTTVVAFAAGVLLWVRGAKLTESATLILGLAGAGSWALAWPVLADLKVLER